MTDTSYANRSSRVTLNTRVEAMQRNTNQTLTKPP